VLASLLGGIAVELTLATWQLSIRGSVQGLFYWLGERFMIFTTPDVARASLFGTPFLRPYGTFSHPNSMAGFYALIHALVFSWQPFRTTQLFRIMRMMILIGSALLVLLSFSKAAVLTLAIGYIVIFGGRLIRQRCWICLIAKGSMLLLLILLVLQAQGDTQGVQKRLWLAQTAINIIQEYPVMGVGPGNALIAQAEYPHPFGTFFLQPVHNIGLLAATELGMVCMGAILALVVRPLMIAYRRNPQATLLCCGLIVLTGMVDHYWLTLQQNILVSAIVFGILLTPAKRFQTGKRPADEVQ
jgi:hypothetical protein